MTKILKYILFRTVLVIITLHTFIPHPHSDELTKGEHSELHKNSKSLYGFIKFVFHESNDNILDNLIFAQYESVKKLELKDRHLIVSAFIKTTSIVRKLVGEKTLKRDINNFDKLLFVKQNKLRGPPILT